MQRRRWQLPWLVLFGQTALFLYFIHQILVFTIVGEWLGWRFNDWPRFYLATALLLGVLLALGWAWQRAKRLVPSPSLASWSVAGALEPGYDRWDERRE